MRSYLALCALCYLLLLVLPLPWLATADKPTPPPAVTTTKKPPATAPTTPSTTAPSSPDKSEAVFNVLDKNAGVIYTFTERDFLIYTVAAEMPASYPTEALKAQAVASYTYYTYQRARDLEGMQGADFDDAPSFPQAYSSEALKTLWGDKYDHYLKRIADAVDAVEGELARYDGKPIFAAYHSCNSGRTASSETVWGSSYPYLRSVVSSGDTLSASMTTTVTVSDNDFAAAFPKLSLKGNASTWIGNTKTADGGIVTSITIGGTELTGRDVRSALDLRSACFTVTHGKDGFTFTVKGYGHAVGMSQQGAKAMADQGFTYKDILQHYYTGITVE